MTDTKKRRDEAIAFAKKIADEINKKYPEDLRFKILNLIQELFILGDHLAS